MYVLYCSKYSCRYSIAQKENNQGYIVDVKLKICLNLDGQEFCIPINEMHFMNQVDIPVCQTRSLVDFRSKIRYKFTIETDINIILNYNCDN